MEVSPMDTPRTIGSSGCTLDDLSAYLDRGRTPRIAAIDDDAECQAILDELTRLGALSRSLVEEDAEPVDAGWLDRLVGGLGRELRAGRDLPYAASTPGRRLVITEGAVREIVRRAGDGVGGVVVGRCRIGGDDDIPHLRIAISVTADRALHDTAELVRASVTAALERDTPLRHAVVDIEIEDVLERRSS
jgi:hypothetical protein